MTYAAQRTINDADSHVIEFDAFYCGNMEAIRGERIVSASEAS